jgi:hypothetical protein
MRLKSKKHSFGRQNVRFSDNLLHYITVCRWLIPQLNSLDAKKPLRFKGGASYGAELSAIETEKFG